LQVNARDIYARTAAIAHFYEMNDVGLRRKKLKTFKGKFRNVIEGRSYTRDKIKKLTEV
jgi:hypothetical protein